MKELYFETENAILRFSHDDVVQRLPYYESTLDTTQDTALRELLFQPDHIVRTPGELSGLAYLGLGLIEKGKGVVYCKACKRYYDAEELKRIAAGHREGPFSAGVKGRALWREVFGRKRTLLLFRGKRYQCPQGHEVIGLVTWRT